MRSQHHITAISAACAQELIHYSIDQLPHEACGILLAHSNNKQIVAFQPITNVHPNNKTAFYFQPQQWIHHFFKAHKDGYSVIGIFHSHPEEDAIPSPSDLQGFSDPDMLYGIVGLKQKDSPQLKFYRYTTTDQLNHYPLMLT